MSWGAVPSPAMPDEVTGNRDRFEVARDEDSLLSHAELAAEVVSSIQRDSDLRRVVPYPSRRLWLFYFREPPLYVQVLSSIFFFIVSVLLADFLFFVFVFFFFWQVATYAKGLARRASLTEGSARAAKSYKAKVTSLTSERAGLQAQIRELTEELVKHRSDLKHASVVRARAEDKEKEVQKDAKVTVDELRLAREEL